jgi:hypothetical protein
VSRKWGPPQWKELVRHLVLHLAIYERTNSIMGLRLSWELSADGNVLDIRRSSFPCLVVRVSFVETRVIHAEFRYRKNDETESIEWEETLGFRGDHVGTVQFSYKGEPLVDHVEAGNIILRPVVDPMFKPQSKDQ